MERLDLDTELEQNKEQTHRPVASSNEQQLEMESRGVNRSDK